MNIELEFHEALALLDPIQDGAASDRIAAAKEKDADRREFFSMRAQVRERIATTLADQMFPPCRWVDEELCEFPAITDGLCRRHAAHKARVAEILA